MPLLQRLAKPPALNHMFVVVGRNVYDALASSYFFQNRFSNVRFNKGSKKSTAPWRRATLTGKKTFLEIYDTFHGMPTGTLGVGFGLDRLGDIDQLKNHAVNYGHHGPQLKIKEHTREEEREEETAPFFRYAQFPPIGRYTSFALEYTQEAFIGKPLLRKPADEMSSRTDVSRERFNAPTVDPSRLLKDIIAIEFELNSYSCSLFYKIAMAAGLQLVEAEDGVQTFQGDNFTLSAIPTESKPVAVTIHASLFRSVKHMERIDLGEGASLTLQEDSATLAFR